MPACAPQRLFRRDVGRASERSSGKLKLSDQCADLQGEPGKMGKDGRTGEPGERVSRLKREHPWRRRVQSAMCGIVIAGQAG